MLLGLGTDVKAKLFLKVYLELDILTSYLFLDKSSANVYAAHNYLLYW